MTFLDEIRCFSALQCGVMHCNTTVHLLIDSNAHITSECANFERPLPAWVILWFHRLIVIFISGFYDGDHKCQWTINPGKPFTIHFMTFDLQYSDGCSIDYVEIAQGG